MELWLRSICVGSAVWARLDYGINGGPIYTCMLSGLTGVFICSEGCYRGYESAPMANSGGESRLPSNKHVESWVAGRGGGKGDDCRLMQEL